MKRSLTISALLFIIIFMTISVMTTIVNSHSWYDPECCGGNDCEPVVVRTDANGNYAVLKNGQKWYIDKPKTQKPSKDDSYHVCIHMNQVWCLYVPPGV